MTFESASDLKTLWTQRAMFYGDMHQTIDDLVGVYHGSLPSVYDEFFHEEQHVHIINMIRLAWDDLANLAGKEFPIYVSPDSDKAKAKKRAEKLEQIGYGYNRAGRLAGGVTMKALQKVLHWWLVGTGSAVLMTLPDYKNQTPYFTFRDPRTHYPPVGWTPWTQAAPADSLFAYQLSVAELKARYPERTDDISQLARRTIVLGLPGGRRGARDEDSTYLWCGEYYHQDCWMTATLEDQVVTLVRSDTGDRGHPGVQPALALSLYSPDGAKGRSIFADQVSIQAAMARMFSQKLDYYDRTLYPLIFTTPLAGKTLKIGPYAVNEFDTTQLVNPRLDTVAPAQSLESDQVMQFAVGMSRMLNRNPESFQGGGDADSAKALSKLQEGVQTTIREGIWPISVEKLPTAYSTAAKMDVNLWGSTRKSATGKRRNANFRVSYIPKVDLEGREDVFEIEPGVGLAGYQGTLQIMQLVQAELMDEDTALEEGEWAREPQEMKRRIQAMRSERLMWADLQAKAAEGRLKSGAMAKLRRMTQSGDDLFDAIEYLEDAKQLYVEMPEMGALPPGLPGPGGPPGLPVPDLAQIRR